jgi:hypothetical protein
MIWRHASRTAAALVVALVCSAPIAPPTAAQMAPDARPHGRSDGMRGGIPRAHVEGHIAFLKAELGITDAQTPLWNKVAAVMREDVAEMKAAMAQAEQRTPETALTYLETRARLTALRAAGEERFLAAFRPLYGALSAEQRKTADELMVHGRP